MSDGRTKEALRLLGSYAPTTIPWPLATLTKLGKQRLARLLWQSQRSTFSGFAEIGAAHSQRCVVIIVIRFFLVQAV